MFLQVFNRHEDHHTCLCQSLNQLSLIMSHFTWYKTCSLFMNLYKKIKNKMVICCFLMVNSTCWVIWSLLSLIFISLLILPFIDLTINYIHYHLLWNRGMCLYDAVNICIMRNEQKVNSLIKLIKQNMFMMLILQKINDKLIIIVFVITAFCVCMYVYICMYTSMHVCMYICMYVCICVYVYVYIVTSVPKLHQRRPGNKRGTPAHPHHRLIGHSCSSSRGGYISHASPTTRETVLHGTEHLLSLSFPFTDSSVWPTSPTGAPHGLTALEGRRRALSTPKHPRRLFPCFTTLLCNKSTLRGHLLSNNCRVIPHPVTLVENAGILVKNHRQAISFTLPFLGFFCLRFLSQASAPPPTWMKSSSGSPRLASASNRSLSTSPPVKERRSKGSRLSVPPPLKAFRCRTPECKPLNCLPRWPLTMMWKHSYECLKQRQPLKGGIRTTGHGRWLPCWRVKLREHTSLFLPPPPISMRRSRRRFWPAWDYPLSVPPSISMSGSISPVCQPVPRPPNSRDSCNTGCWKGPHRPVRWRNAWWSTVFSESFLVLTGRLLEWGTQPPPWSLWKP